MYYLFIFLDIHYRQPLTCRGKVGKGSQKLDINY